jgi:hypothetical protein
MRLWWLASLSIYTHVDVVMVFDQELIKPSFSKSREIRITGPSSHADGIACDWLCSSDKILRANMRLIALSQRGIFQRKLRIFNAK